MTRLGFAVAIGASMTVAAFVTIVTRPAPAVRAAMPPIVAASTEGDVAVPTFEETWRSAAVPASLQSASLFAMFRALLSIKEIDRNSRDTVAAEPPASSPIAIAAVPGVSKSAKRRNICERHGMRKVKHGRYGWRCRK